MPTHARQSCTYSCALAYKYLPDDSAKSPLIVANVEREDEKSENSRRAYVTHLTTG